jgi:hypothetical protein
MAENGEIAQAFAPQHRKLQAFMVTFSQHFRVLLEKFLFIVLSGDEPPTTIEEGMFSIVTRHPMKAEQVERYLSKNVLFENSSSLTILFNISIKKL